MHKCETLVNNDNRASGWASFAAGHLNLASGTQSIAFGREMYVGGNYSFGINLFSVVESKTLNQSNVMAIMNGKDAALSGGGFLIIGKPSGYNVVYDNDEIMARNNGSTSALHLNKDGGTVYINNIAQSGSKKIFERSKPMNYGLKDILKLQPHLGINKKSTADGFLRFYLPRMWKKYFQKL